MNKNLNLTEKEKQAIKELLEELKKLYGNNLIRTILYGSKARGDSEKESDVDLLVVLKEMGLTYDEIKRINNIAAPICLRYNLVLSAIPVEEKEASAEYKTIFIYNVFNEGVELLK